MNNEDKIIELMTERVATGSPFYSLPAYYSNPELTHRSYAAHLINTKRGSKLYYVYLRRCYEWLILCKENNIELKKIET